MINANLKAVCILPPRSWRGNRLGRNEVNVKDKTLNLTLTVALTLTFMLT